MRGVAHLSSVHPLHDTRILHRECRALSDAGYEVSLVIRNDRDDTYRGVRILGLPGYSNRVQRMIMGPARVLLRALRIPADIFHFHDPELIPVGLFLKAIGKRVIMDVHEDLPAQVQHKTWIPLVLRAIVGRAIGLIEAVTARFFDAVVTATPYIAARFKVYNPRTVVVANLPVLEEFSNTASQNSRENAVCYVGAITKERGIFDMLRAVALCETNLHLVGEVYPESLIQVMKNTPGWERVIYHGRLGRDGVAGILSRCKVGLVCLHPTPNYVNAWPVKLFEYMAAGVPFVASDFPVWKELVGRSKAGVFVSPERPREIADAIACILRDESSCQTLSKNGRRFVAEEMNWNSEARTLIGLYDGLSQ